MSLLEFFKNSFKRHYQDKNQFECRLIINDNHSKLCSLIIVLGWCRKKFFFLGRMVEDLEINIKVWTTYSRVHIYIYMRICMHTYQRQNKVTAEKIDN